MLKFPLTIEHVDFKKFHTPKYNFIVLKIMKKKFNVNMGIYIKTIFCLKNNLRSYCLKKRIEVFY